MSSLVVLLLGQHHVHSGADSVWGVLAALPCLLHHHPLPPQHHAGLVHPAHVPSLLLAGHVQLLRQPNRLLCYEQTVDQRFIAMYIFL